MLLLSKFLAISPFDDMFEGFKIEAFEFDIPEVMKFVHGDSFKLCIASLPWAARVWCAIFFEHRELEGGTAVLKTIEAKYPIRDLLQMAPDSPHWKLVFTIEFLEYFSASTDERLAFLNTLTMREDLAAWQEIGRTLQETVDPLALFRRAIRNGNLAWLYDNLPQFKASVNELKPLLKSRDVAHEFATRHWDLLSMECIKVICDVHGRAFFEDPRMAARFDAMRNRVILQGSGRDFRVVLYVMSLPTPTVKAPPLKATPVRGLLHAPKPRNHSKNPLVMDMMNPMHVGTWPLKEYRTGSARIREPLDQNEWQTIVSKVHQLASPLLEIKLCLLMMQNRSVGSMYVGCGDNKRAVVSFFVAPMLKRHMHELRNEIIRHQDRLWVLYRNAHTRSYPIWQEIVQELKLKTHPLKPGMVKDAPTAPSEPELVVDTDAPKEVIL